MDLNADGYRDILSGSYSRRSQPMAGLFQVLWGRADGKFKKAETLQGTDGEPLIIPVVDRDKDPNDWINNICTRPTAVDWDGDGKLDLVVGNFPGTFYLFAGEGEGRFRPQPEIIKADGQPLRIQGNHSDPFVVDWDGDGDLDIVSGSGAGGVQWAENEAGPGKTPKLKAFESLIEPAQGVKAGEVLRQDDLKGPASATRVWVADVNNDGKLDVLVGDRVTLVSPAEGTSAEDMRKKYAEWQKAVVRASKELNDTAADATARQEATQRWQQLYQQRNKFVQEEPTGYVWLYLRK